MAAAGHNFRCSLIHSARAAGAVIDSFDNSMDRSWMPLDTAAVAGCWVVGCMKQALMEVDSKANKGSAVGLGNFDCLLR